MADQQVTRPPGETTGGNISEFNATSGDIRVLMHKLGVMENKIDRLIEDRKDDRKDIKESIKDIINELKEFKKSEFKELQGDVLKLRLNWAKVIGMTVVVGFIISFGTDLLKKHFGG